MDSAMDIEWPADVPLHACPATAQGVMHSSKKVAPPHRATKAMASRPPRATKAMKTGQQLRAAVGAACASGGPVFLEIFSGSGRLTKAMSDRGIPSMGIDINDGYDMLHADVLGEVLALIRQGRALGVWLATPCGGLGRARRGKPWAARVEAGIFTGFPAAIRSDKHVWGLPDHELSPKDRVALANSNAGVHVSLKIIEACRAAGVPVAMENPARSFLWIMPEVLSLMEQEDSYHMVCDLCAYGTPWKKATALLFHGWAGVSKLSKTCHAVKIGKGHRPLCGFSAVPHVTLSGIDKQKRSWKTTLAEPYPWPLVEEISGVFKAMCQG